MFPFLYQPSTRGNVLGLARLSTEDGVVDGRVNK